jgi:hypothetical protein
MSAKDQPPFLILAGRLCGWFAYFTWRDAGTAYEETPDNRLARAMLCLDAPLPWGPTAVSRRYFESEQEWRYLWDERKKRFEEVRAHRMASRTVPIDPGLERTRYVMRRRSEGATLATIGAEIGVGAERVRGIEAKERRREKWKAERVERERKRVARALLALAKVGMKRRIAVMPDAFNESWTPERQWREGGTAPWNV